MLAALLIMLREGLEAALIVGIIAAYLKKTGRTELMRPMWIGVALAAAVCLVAGIAMNAANAELPFKAQEAFEGIVRIAAVVILTWMIFWMRKAGRTLKGELEAKIEAAVATPGKTAGTALVAMAFFAVLREGLESALFLLAAFKQGGAASGVGAVIGLAIAVALGWGLYQGGLHLDLGRFFTYTGVLLIFVAAGLFAGALHAFHEAGIWNVLQGEAWDTSAVAGKNGTVGTVLAGLFGYNPNPSVGEVIAYWAYLIPTMILFVRGSRTPSRKPTAPTAVPTGAAA